MANKYVTDEVRKQIGMQSEARVVEVERGAIRRFAEAIGDPDPLFNDEAAARKTRFGGMIAPPTFCRSLGAAIPEIKIGMGRVPRPRRRLGVGIFRADSARRPNQRGFQDRRHPRERGPARRNGLHHGRDQLHQSLQSALRLAALDRDPVLSRPRDPAREKSKMAKQTYWEDVEAGTEVPALEKNPTTQQLVRYAGASGDFYQIHYDKDFALNNNLPGVILHGALKNGFLGQMMTDFAGHEGWLRKLAVQYRGMDQPGSKVMCKGKVVKKYAAGNEHLVDCEIWLENAKGEKTTIGSATVMLPSREGAR